MWRNSSARTMAPVICRSRSSNSSRVATSSDTGTRSRSRTSSWRATRCSRSPTTTTPCVHRTSASCPMPSATRGATRPISGCACCACTLPSRAPSTAGGRGGVRGARDARADTGRARRRTRPGQAVRRSLRPGGHGAARVHLHAGLPRRERAERPDPHDGGRSPRGASPCDVHRPVHARRRGQRSSQDREGALPPVRGDLLPDLRPGSILLRRRAGPGRGRRSRFAPVGASHGFAALGTEPLCWIEVQSPMPPASGGFTFHNDWSQQTNIG